MIRLPLRSLWLAAALLPCLAQAQTAFPAPASVPAASAPRIDYVVKGKDFRVLAKPLRDDPHYTDVVMFFWYGSPWAAQVEPLLRQWIEQGRAGPNVRLRLVPVVLDGRWAFAARIFYALDQMGLQYQLTPRLLQAAAHQRVDLASPASVSEWLGQQGVDPKAFSRSVNSPLVIARVSGLVPMAREYEVRSTPTFVIDGRYQIAAHEQMPPERAAAVAMFMADKLARGGARP